MSYLSAILQIGDLLNLDVIARSQVEPKLQILEGFAAEEVVGDIVATHVQTLARRAQKRGHHDVAGVLSYWHEQRFAAAA